MMGWLEGGIEWKHNRKKKRNSQQHQRTLFYNVVIIKTNIVMIVIYEAYEQLVEKFEVWGLNFSEMLW